MSMINNGIAGMQASSMSLLVTSNNIANSSVPGYSRQQVVYSTTPTGSVYVSDIERVTDEFYVSQLQEAGTSLGYTTTYASQSTTLEQTLSNEAMSLSPVLNEFYASLEAAQADPMDPAYRQEVLADAGNLANQFNTIAGEIDDQLSEVDDQLNAMVGEANALIAEVASLNEEIMAQEAQGGASPDLLDKRDQSVQQLSELVGLEVVYQDNNTVDLFMQNGEKLVVGGSASELVLVPGSPDAQMSQVGVKNGDTTKTMSDVGGALQGQLDFRDEELLPAQRELDRMALVMADAINEQLSQGYDLNGDPGESLFNDINDVDAMRNRASASKGNAGDAILEVEISDPSALTADNYMYTLDQNGNLVVSTVPGNDEVSYTTNPDGSISFDGVTVSVDTGTMQPGDSYYLEPGKDGASGIDVVMEDPSKLAFSSDPTEPGNNENLLELSDLQDAELIEGNTSIGDAYNSLVVGVATATSAAMADYEASAVIYQSANNNLMSVAGVNLDEEAANLVVFQQAYSANAKVISTADQLFQELLSI